MDARDSGRQHSIACHDVEDAHLSQQRGQHHRRVPGETAEGDDPIERVILANRTKRVENRRALGEPIEAQNADRAERQRHIKYSTQRESEDNPDRHVARGTFRFFRRDGNSVEADIREEDERGARHDAVITERRKGPQVRRMDRMRDGGDEDQHRNDLQHDERAIDTGRFADADRDQNRYRKRRDAGEKIHLQVRAVKVRGLGPTWERDPDVGEHVLEIVGERRRGRSER